MLISSMKEDILFFFFNEIGREVMCKANCYGANNLSFLPSRMFTWRHKQKEKPLHMKEKGESHPSSSSSLRLGCTLAVLRGKPGVAVNGEGDERGPAVRMQRSHCGNLSSGSPSNAALVPSQTGNTSVLRRPDAGTNRIFLETATRHSLFPPAMLSGGSWHRSCTETPS